MIESKEINNGIIKEISATWPNAELSFRYKVRHLPCTADRSAEQVDQAQQKDAGLSPR